MAKYSGDLHGELQLRDPAGAARLEPGDRQRNRPRFGSGGSNPASRSATAPSRGNHGLFLMLAGVDVERCFLLPDRRSFMRVPKNDSNG